MKYLILFLALLPACRSTTEAEKKVFNAGAIFERSLIIGASISANYNGVPSPGDKLKEKFAPTGSLEKISKNGARSSEILSQLSSKDFNQYSSIIAVDLFFWDSSELSCSSATSNVQQLVGQVANSKAKLFVGNVPRLPRVPMQPCMNAINSTLEDVCQSKKNCFVIPLKATYEKLEKEGKIEFQSRFYDRQQLIPDGLHLTQKASELVADQIIESALQN